MSTAANSPGALAYVSHDDKGPSVPWYIWVGVVAVTSSTIGGVWDVSWHRSIGRDSFWTPAHMLIYACGVLAGIVGLFLVLQYTFGKDARCDQLQSASSACARLWASSSPDGAAWPCSPPRPSITGGTTPMAWMSRSSPRRTQS